MKKSSLSGIKNIIWALSIFAALLALFVGLIFSVSGRYSGERESGVLMLGQSGNSESFSDDGVIFTADDSSYAAGGSVLEMPSTQDNGLEAVYNYTFLCDSTISDINNYGTDFGSSAAVQLWTDDGSGLSAANAADTKIIYPSDGSLITPSSAAMVNQPRRLVIYIGGDDLASASRESFIAGYTRLISEIRKVSGETTVICCSVGSVSSVYPATDGLNAQLITQANTWIRQVCADTGAYYADLASLLNDENGFLRDEYSSPDGRSLGSAGIAKIVEYFRFHSV